MPAKNWEKLKTVVGGLPGNKIERKPSIGSSTCSLVVYPRIHDSMVTISLALSEKMLAEYGGMSIRTWTFSRRKFENFGISWEGPALGTNQLRFQ